MCYQNPLELGVCHVTFIGEMVYKKSMIFEVLWACLGEFLIFLRDILLVARSYRIVAINIKSLNIGALVTLVTRFKVTILAIFDAIGHFSSCLFWQKPVAHDTDFF